MQREIIKKVCEGARPVRAQSRGSAAPLAEPIFDIPAWPEAWNEEIVPPPPSWPDLERPPSHTATYSEVGASAIEGESEASDVDSGDPPPGEDVGVDALEPSVVASTFPTIASGMTGVTHAARQVEECVVKCCLVAGCVWGDS